MNPEDVVPAQNLLGAVEELGVAAAGAFEGELLDAVGRGGGDVAQNVEHLFLPFTRLEERTRHDGFGLGLALVTSIAGIHNGTVHATAVAAGGLDITVRIPRRDNAVTPAPPST